MAVHAGRFVVFLACVLFCISNVSESKERSKNGCVVCGKKLQGSPFRHVEKNEALEVCFGGSQWRGPFDGWRLKVSRFDGWRLNFSSFDGWRLIFRNDVYHTNLKQKFDCKF